MPRVRWFRPLSPKLAQTTDTRTLVPRVDLMAAPGDRRVHVSVRVRPPISEDAGATSAVQCSGSSAISLDGRGRFGPFDAVFSPAAEQSEVYERCARRVVDTVVAGESNGTVLCYGQTGSGKTHTVGIRSDGLLPRALTQVFEAVGTAGGAAQYTLWLSCMQLYLEQVEDLLNLGQAAVKLREDANDPWGPVVIEGLVRHPLSSLQQALPPRSSRSRRRRRSSSPPSRRAPSPATSSPRSRRTSRRCTAS